LGRRKQGPLGQSLGGKFVFWGTRPGGENRPGGKPRDTKPKKGGLGLTTYAGAKTKATRQKKKKKKTLKRGGLLYILVGRGGGTKQKMF